jgi:UPF0755 protein
MKKQAVKQRWLILILLILIIGFSGGIIYYAIHFSTFYLKKPVTIYIDNQKDYPALLTHLQSTAEMKYPQLFDLLAQRMKYPENMKTGRYEIHSGMTYLQTIRMLRNGQQTPIKLTFNNIRLKSDLVDRIAQQLMFSPADLLSLLNDPSTAASYGLDTTTIVSLFIPNTYEIYWNISASKFLERMKKEHDRFWNPERRAKAQAMHLSPVEVSILASIVEEESSALQEYSTIAGLYLNRLKKGMLLQADPTLKFSAGDFTLKRLLNRHKEIDSPYNTYMYAGLPPGPIRIPSIPGIDSVLNYTEHNYLYMCAKEDLSGTHNFAVTFAEHNRNAQRYGEALNRLNIK